MEALTTGGTGRYYATEPIPDQVLMRALDASRFAPNGGNRQPMRWIVVRDPERRRALAELYLPHWKSDMEAYLKGAMRSGGASLDRAVAAADHFAEHFAEVPVILVAVGKLDDMHPGVFNDDGCLNMIAGASVYPFVQNACLALRAEGIATTITTLICLEEEKAREILGLPDNAVCACHVAAGYPADGFLTKLTRMPVGEFVFGERWGEPMEPAATATRF
jgi:nitroreductase